MRRKVIVGIGNRMMKDDSIGIHVTEFLKKTLKYHELKIIVAETDAYYCLNKLKRDDFLIIIDATYNRKEPGTISVVSLQTVLQSRYKAFSQHEMSLFDLILLYYGKMDGYLIGIEVSEIGFGLALSQTLGGKFQSICHEMTDYINKILEE